MGAHGTGLRLGPAGHLELVQTNRLRQSASAPNVDSLSACVDHPPPGMTPPRAERRSRRLGGLVFCSGMAGIDPATGAIADGIEAQTEQALLNLAAVLRAAGSSMQDVVKTTIFYADVEDFGRLNEVYARHMPDPPPARSAPANVRLPRGLLVSIEAIAVLPSSST